jgi:lipopolysaccharide transport system ATP-binding protein
MTKPAIIFDKVSKHYFLHHQKIKTRTMRGVLSSLNPFIKNPASLKSDTDEEFWALKNVSFEIMPGESVGIVGPNGSGKSTSLKILAGVTEPTTGSYKINGKLGVLIEVGAGFHPELTGRENVYLNGSILGMRKAEIKQKFDSILEFSEIERFIDTPVKYYSSGMYVRLGFSVAIHNEPDIMLVDEVLAVGDLNFQKKCFARMEDFKKQGRTFILVSHAMSQIQTMCSRALLLRQGSLVHDGSSDEVANSYFDLSNEISKKEEAESMGISNDPVIIEELHLISEEHNLISHCEINVPLRFQVTMLFRELILDPVIVLVLRRGGVRIYSSNTRILNLRLGEHKGRTVYHCNIPDIPIAPNEFDVEVYIYDETQKILYSHKKFPGLFRIDSPSNLAILGSALPIEYAERGVVFSPAQWNRM